MENCKKNNNQKEQREKNIVCFFFLCGWLVSVEKSNKLQEYDGVHCSIGHILSLECINSMGPTVNFLVGLLQEESVKCER